MSDELDPHLAALLRRGPVAPAALDEAHRAAVLAEARQAWFRLQSRRQRRRNLFTVAAACLAAGVAGWSLRVVNEPPALQAIATLDQALPAAVAPIVAKPAPRVMEGLRPAEAAGDIGATSTPVEATAGAATSVVANQGLVVIAAPAPAAPAAAFAMQDAGPAAEREERKKEEDSIDVTAAPMPAKAMRSALTREAVAEDRGPLAAATAVLDAALAGRIPPTDRQPALRAALRLIADLREPGAVDLRRRIGAALAAP